MDVHGDKAVILTYRGIYTYTRNEDEDWFDALNRRPRGQSLGRIPGAEAAVISNDQSATFVTVERKRPPLYRAAFPQEDKP